MFHSLPEPNSDGFSSRRQFLRAAGALTMGAAFAGAVQAAGPESEAAGTEPSSGGTAKKEAPLMQIGILLGTFARPTIEARLDAARAHGLVCAQLSMDCAGLPAMPDKIAPELADRVRRAAADRGIALVSLHGTFNMSHPGADQRRDGLRRLQVLASACPRLGISKIHICTGTRDRGNMWRRHPDNDLPSIIGIACS